MLKMIEVNAPGLIAANLLRWRMGNRTTRGRKREVAWSRCSIQGERKNILDIFDCSLTLLLPQIFTPIRYQWGQR